MSCLSRCPYFRGVLNEGFHCIKCHIYMYIQVIGGVGGWVYDLTVEECHLRQGGFERGQRAGEQYQIRIVLVKHCLQITVGLAL